MLDLGRRHFLTLLGGAVRATWPLAARAQQAERMPVVGFLYGGSPETSTHLVAAFRKGLGETGYIEGRNVAIDFRFAEGPVRPVARARGRSGSPWRRRHRDP